MTLKDEVQTISQRSEALLVPRQHADDTGLSRNQRLKVASVLLSYPGADFLELLDEIRETCEETKDHAVLCVVNALAKVTVPEIIRTYVSTFDMQESTALYLTSHELGDSRERGGALLRLHAMLRSAALEPLEGELPDYLPLLLEFLAEKPFGMPTEDLEQRLAVVCVGICERLDVSHPYNKLFEFIGALLPKVTKGVQDVEQLLSKPLQKTDEDNLPYPLVYD